MLATAMSLVVSASVRVEVTQSMPQMTCDVVPLPGAVEDLGGEHARPRRDAHDAGAVVARGDRAGDVRAVAVVVVGRGARRHAVAPAGDGEVRVVEVDAGVDDGDVGGARVARGGRRRGLHAAHAGRGAVPAARAAVARTSRSGATTATAASARRRSTWLRFQLGGEALDRAAVAQLGLEAVAALARVRLGTRVRDRVLVQDDVLAGDGLGRAVGGSSVCDGHAEHGEQRRERATT
jgi:hypothetical protein